MASGRRVMFDDWMRQVDGWISKLTGGLSHEDLPTLYGAFPYREAFAGGFDPEVIARRAVMDAREDWELAEPPERRTH